MKERFEMSSIGSPSIADGIGKKIALAVIPIILLILAFFTSSTFDAKVTSLSSFLRGISPLYWVAYYFIIGVLLYFGYNFFNKRKDGPSEGLSLFYILLFAFATYFLLFLFTNPLHFESARYAQVLHILGNGTLRGLPFPQSSVGNPLFWSALTDITGLDFLSMARYFPPVYLFSLTAIILYLTLRMITDRRLAFGGALFTLGASWNMGVFGEHFFAWTLFALFMAVLVKFLNGKEGGEVSVLLLLIFASLVISYPLSLLFMAILLICLLSGIVYRRTEPRKVISRLESIEIRTRNILAYSVVVFFSWYLLNYSRLPGFGRLKGLWNMLVGGAVKVRAVEALEMKANFLVRLFQDLRILVVAVFVLTPLVVFLVYFYRKKRSLFSNLDLKTISLMGCYSIFLAGGIAGSLISLTTGARIFMFCLIIAPIPISVFFYRFRERRIPFLYLVQLGVGLSLIVFLIFIPGMSFLQHTSEEVNMILNFSRYGDAKSNSYGIGPVVQRHRWTIYATKKDIEVQEYPVYPSPAPIGTPEKLDSEGSILIDGSAVRTEYKYVYSTTPTQQIASAQKVLEDFGYDKIYSSSDTYSVWISRRTIQR